MSEQRPSLSYPCLRWVNPQGEQELHNVSGLESSIGRSPDSDITLFDSRVSRQHARIVKAEEGYSIVDARSTHGTFVNRERITERFLKHGDRILVGRVELRFLLQPLVTDHLPLDSTDSKSLENSLEQFAKVVSSPEDSPYAELEKLRHILDFQYQWGQQFSDEHAFRQILHSTLQISGAERGFILVKQKGRFEYAVGLDGEGRVLTESEFRASHTVVDQVAARGEPLFLTGGIGGELAEQQSILEMRLQAVACLPLRGISPEFNRPQILGILYLDSTKAMHALSGLDQKVLTKLASEGEGVLEKVELVKSIKERNQFEKELAVAHDIQRNLLPHSLPEFAHFQICAYCEPTRHVGGDFYDFLQVRPRALVGVLADVSGKGVPAALLSALLQGALDMECRSSGELETALERVNQLLFDRSRSNDFATLFAFSLNPEGQGHYVSAGHNPAYLLRASNGEIEKLTEGGLILGAFGSASYQSEALRLTPGDVLMVYSDGITEAENPESEMFGEKRLQEVFKRHGFAELEVLKQHILESIDEFTQSKPQMDDMTLLLLRH